MAEEKSIVVCFGNTNKSGYFDRLYVHKDFLKKGMGYAIVDNIEEFALQKRMSNITLHALITSKTFFEKNILCAEKMRL